MSKTADQSTEKPTESKPMNKPLSKKLPLWRGVIKSKYFPFAVILILAFLPALYFYNQNRMTQRRLNDPNTANQEVINEVVKKVKRHILLPSDEQPTLASVSDINKVKDQPFFQNAQNDDKVLVYTNARKAILYRPSKDIIIEVAPLNIGSLKTQ